ASVLITRSIVRPLAEVMAAAGAVAHGDPERPITVDARSELVALASSMRAMVAALTRDVGAQRDMHQAHDAATISDVMPAASFPGAYGTIATGLNDLVAPHIAVKMHVVDTVALYARGDLTQDLDRLRGAKARISTTSDAVKQSML